ncbi:MAG TPA: hypothetical protein PK306_24495 [Aquabacterium sp.]|nr:hypothetical protein [Aquabacterium sp.]
MGITAPSRCTDIDWLAEGPIGPYVAAFKQFLIDHQYAVFTSANYLADVKHFARWVRGRRLSLQRINEAAVVEFLDEHLPTCRCTGPVPHDRRDHRAALRNLLTVLRAQGAIAPPPVSTRPVDEELQSYDEYLAHARGLAAKTRSGVVRIVGRLLTEHFGDHAIDIASLRPVHVRRFFAQQAKLYSKPAGAGSVVSALRGYFRYRASLGDAVHGGLVNAIAYPRQLAVVLVAQDADRRGG